MFEKEGNNKEGGNKIVIITSVIIGVIILGLLILILVSILMISFKGPFKEPKMIKPDTGVQEAIVSEDFKNLLVTADEPDPNYNISEAVFVLKDENDESYTYIATENKDIDYEFSSDDFNIKDFKKIKSISVKYEYVPRSEPIVENGCNSDSECNDNISCTADVCFNGRCIAIPDNSLCSDGNPCNGVEYCELSGGCRNGTHVNCSSFDDQCNTGSCSETNGSCIKIPRPNNQTCNDNFNCTVNDVCFNGICKGTNQNLLCSDNIGCTEDVCNNGTCQNNPRDDWCNESKKCQASVGCVLQFCSRCEYCNNFFSDCDYVKCHADCSSSGQCYYTGNAESECISLDYACANLVTSCSNYNNLECNNDLCNLSCEWKNNICTEKEPAFSCINKTKCSDYVSSQECITDLCNMSCQWNNSECKKRLVGKYSLGSGGKKGDSGKLTFTASNGGKSYYYLYVPEGNSLESPNGMIFYLHGDSFAEETSGKMPKIFTTIREMNFIGLIPASPTTTSFLGKNWRTSGEFNAVYLQELLEKEVFPKYNVNLGQMYLTGASGGAQFIASYFMPLYINQYDGGTLLMCGGTTFKPSLLSQISDETKEEFRMYYYDGKDDWLLSNIKIGIENYQKLGMKHMTIDIDNPGGHCEFPEGLNGAIKEKVPLLYH